MKAAILLYGQLRRFDISDQTFNKNIIKSNNIDFDIFGFFGPLHTDNVEDFNKKYNPKILKIEKDPTSNEIKEKYKLNKDIKITDHLLFQLNSLENCFNTMFEYKNNNSIEYDFYIKTRTDLIFNQKIDLNIDKYSAYVCKNKYGQNIKEYTTDLLMATKSIYVIEKFSKMGYDIENAINKLKKADHYHHEEILAKYLEINNIEIKTHNVEIDLARNIIK